MKGALDTLTDYLYLIVAILVGALMLYFVAKYAGIFSTSEDNDVFGDRVRVSQRIASEIEKCWDQHRGGLDSSSDICIELKVNCTQNFSEKTVTDFLDCKKIPNNNCTPGNCSACTLKSYDDKEKVEWYVSHSNAVLEISYSGSKRRVIVRELGVSGKVSGVPSNNTSSNGSFSVKIISPQEGSTFSEGQVVLFNSMVSGGNPPYFYMWEMDGGLIPRNITSFNRSDFELGTHFVNLTVKDSANNTATAKVSIKVVSNNPGDNPPNSLCANILYSGDSATKLDILFLGHGYASLSSFESDARAYAVSLLSYEPFKSNSNKLNVRFLNKSVDLGCHYNCQNVQRCICCEDGKVIAEAKACSADQMIVIVNSNEYGGCSYLGSGIAAVYRGDPRIAAHEIGHGFGVLFDEYSYGIDSVNCDPFCDEMKVGTMPNCDTSSSCPKWSSVSGLGCIRECAFTDYYRPSDKCMMKSMDFGFCAVCQRHLNSLLSKYAN